MMTMPDTAAALFDLLLSGVDIVECAYYLRPVAGPGIDFEALAAKKEQFRLAKGKDPMLVTLGGMDFLLQGYGTKSGYPFVLENRNFTILCGEFNNPPFFVTFRSEALWRNTAQGPPCSAKTGSARSARRSRRSSSVTTRALPSATCGCWCLRYG